VIGKGFEREFLQAEIMKFKNYIHYLLNEKIQKSEIIFVLASLVVTTALLMMPTGFEKALIDDAHPAKAVVTSVDNSGLHTIGIVHTGEQILDIKIVSGKFYGLELNTVNHLIGKMDLDKIYKEGETVYSVIQVDNGQPSGVTVIDRYRINYQWILLAMFMLLLIFYAGWVGVKAIISFAFSAVFIWKVLLPGYLNNVPPVMLSLFVVTVMTSVIIFLVAGFNRKGMTAFLGALSGVFFNMYTFYNIRGIV